MQLSDITPDNKIIIFGAHLVALECMRLLKGEKCTIIGFAVSDMSGNPEQIDGYPVKPIREYAAESGETVVIIATPEKYHDIIEANTRLLGFTKFCRVGLDDLSKIKGRRIIQLCSGLPDSELIVTEDKRDCCWLSLFKKGYPDSGEEHLKFPTLFYLNEKELTNAIKVHGVFDNYHKTCGKTVPLPRLSWVERDGCQPEDQIRIYMAFTENNVNAIQNRDFDPWIKPLQVGSKFADHRYGDLFDDTGLEISDKNRLLCEMTGAYWVWKSAPETDYKGLCHYRRTFAVGRDGLKKMISNDVDVLLPTARYIPGSVRDMFLAETPVKQPVMAWLEDALQQIHFEDFDGFCAFLQDHFYFPNNLVVAKRRIYDEYCDWVFSVLFRLLEMEVEKQYDRLEDRHLGYVAELLTSYFFIKNKDRLHIVTTDYFYGV